MSVTGSNIVPEGAKKPLPPRDVLLDHIWKLAAVVHPRTGTMSELTWINRILLHYGVERETIDGKLSYQWACFLWAELLRHESDFLQDVAGRM